MIKFSKAIAGRMRTAARRLTRQEEGTATIEFVLFFPVFLTVFMSAFESGLLMTRQVMLERAMDVSIRNLRLGSWDNPTPELLKQTICDWATVFPDCMDVMMLELRPVSTVTWTPLDPNITCVDRNEEIQPLVEFDAGSENEMMLVRACAVFDPIFPLTGLGLNLPLDASGGYQLAATSAFVNEPD